MATPQVIDVEPLLAPVSDEQPAGPELRSAADADQRAYHAVRDARKKASDAERRGRMFALLSEDEKEMEPAVPEAPDWETVHDLSLAALNRSRDLWITAWLIEALVRMHGFAGVRDGFHLAHQLCDRFWDHVHPRPAGGETLADTFAQLAGLNGVDSEGTLIAPIMAIPVTGQSGSREYSCADYLDAADLERKDPEIRAHRIQQGAASTEMVQRAVVETGVEYLQNVMEDIDGAIAAFDQFHELLGGKVADLPNSHALLPPSSSIRDALAECRRLFRALTRQLLGSGEMDEEETGVTLIADGQSGGMASARVHTRDEAFRALLQVSDYFRRAEPHSPVSYALEQVVKWGRMSLPELLAELIEDSSARREIFKRTGIQDPSSKEN